MKVILFVEKDFNFMMTAADLTDGGTKVFGDYIIATVEKEGDVNKIILTDRMVAAYCNGKSAIREGIKTLSDGTHFISVDEFKAYCENIIKNENQIYLQSKKETFYYKG